MRPLLPVGLPLCHRECRCNPNRWNSQYGYCIMNGLRCWCELLFVSANLCSSFISPLCLLASPENAELLYKHDVCWRVAAPIDSTYYQAGCSLRAPFRPTSALEIVTPSMRRTSPRRNISRRAPLGKHRLLQFCVETHQQL
ncbi:hypothetical protein K440DRAFT_282164 [Wilcoxina mikolae CBS 423.85]|nr:hypothetical protein K440DRAFT_282164 [Wilcoxina mikolae CBS 423.85]